MHSKKSPGYSKPGKRWKWAGLTALLWTGAAIQAQPASGLTPESEHQFVEAGRLGGVGGLDRAEPANRLQAKQGMAAFVTRDTLYLLPLTWECTLLMCGGECQAFGRMALAVPLPGLREAQPPVMGLIRVVRTSSELRVVVAVARAAGAVHRMEIVIDDGAVKDVKRTSYNHQLPERSIRAFGDARELSADVPEGILAFGTDGLFRRVVEGSNGAMTEVVLDQSVPTDFISYGNGWVGSDAGRIHKVASLTGSPNLVFVQSPTLQPIQRIGFLTAFCANGQYFVHQFGGWSGPYGTPGKTLGAHPRFSLAGTVVREFPEQGMVEKDLGDSPGYMADAAFKTMKYTGKAPLTFKISLRDEDRNMKQPMFNIFHGDFGGLFSREFVQADPGVGCAATGICLQGFENNLTVSLAPESVTVSIPVLKGVRSLDSVCKKAYFKGAAGEFKSVQRWWSGSSLDIAVGKDTVRIQYGEPLSIRAMVSNPARRNGIRVDAGMGFMAAPWEGATFDAAGRMASPSIRDPRP